MSLPKRFDKEQEQSIYQQWEDADCFEPAPEKDNPALVMMMPPPNVTGNLHVGHALDNTLPDIILRHARMNGKDAFYQPGTDHASIAVHVKLDGALRKEGKTRFDLGRDEFLKRAWAWKDEKAGAIQQQLRKLGTSCAWQRERFTMDEKYLPTVQQVFVEFYNRGLIYRGQRLVNWDPNMQTAVSDLEVSHAEVAGYLWHFKYPFADGFTYTAPNGTEMDGIIIATTRPETILADGAIAMNPSDPRAADLVGKEVVVPIVNRRIPLITDEYVDSDFGSGMVKITAAHDFNDWEVSQRCTTAEIPVINLMNPDATMNENCPPEYQGMDRFDARNKVIEDFKELGLFIKAEPHTHNVPRAERDDTILEPYLTNQWFVKGKPLAEKCLQAAKNGELEFINPRDDKIFHHWLNNIQDWCVSRQLWWGQRIPAWYKGDDVKVQMESPGEGWKQDDDVLDTWFSSAQWPFVTQNWPEETPELAKYYPGTAIMTGRDILFFWIIRMCMMGLELTGKVPFKTIYTHGMVLDEHGQKMSKTKGNTIDALEVIEQYGADAVRYTLAGVSTPGGLDIKLGESQIEQGRNFVTKIWNAARFLEMQQVTPVDELDLDSIQQPVNKWIVSQLAQAFERMDKAVESYQFHEVAGTLYDFVWATWCDWYLELAKGSLNGDDAAAAAETRQVMGWAWPKVLQLAHPLMPFVTEQLWQHLTAANNEQFLMQQAWPQHQSWPQDDTVAKAVNQLQEVVTAIRAVRSQYRVAPKARINVGVRTGNDAAISQLQQFMPQLTGLAGVANLSAQTAPNSATSATAVVGELELVLELGDVVDMAAERERIAKEMAKIEAELQKINGLLGNDNFRNRAPAKVIAENEAKQSELTLELQNLQRTLDQGKAAA